MRCKEAAMCFVVRLSILLIVASMFGLPIFSTPVVSAQTKCEASYYSCVGDCGLEGLAHCSSNQPWSAACQCLSIVAGCKSKFKLCQLAESKKMRLGREKQNPSRQQ